MSCWLVTFPPFAVHRHLIQPLCVYFLLHFISACLCMFVHLSVRFQFIFCFLICLLSCLLIWMLGCLFSSGNIVPPARYFQVDIPYSLYSSFVFYFSVSDSPHHTLLLQRKTERWTGTAIRYIYFPNDFLVILCNPTSLTLMFVYCKYESLYLKPKTSHFIGNTYHTVRFVLFRLKYSTYWESDREEYVNEVCNVT
jgi:hypothetical protein